MFTRLAAALLVAAPAFAPTARAPVPAPAPAPALKIVDVRSGEGLAAVPGMTVTVRYTGWLAAGGKRGQKFDASDDHDRLGFSFPLGAGQVIPGWDQGVQGMKIGGKRTLTIPPELGYGSAGAGGVIPPDATLIFDIELLGVR